MHYTARVFWKKKPEEPFTDNKYSRAHTWSFDGGVELPASASPQVVPVPLSDASAVDPEEAFVASLASCHMLFFLSLAAGKHYQVERYEDQAEGLMSKDENGRMAITVVTLRPNVTFSGANLPTREQIAALHQSAHEKCFLANSVKAVIHIIGS